MGRSELIPGRVESRMQAGRQADKRWRNFFNNLFSRSVIGVVGERTNKERGEALICTNGTRQGKGQGQGQGSKQQANCGSPPGSHTSSTWPRENSSMG